MKRNMTLMIICCFTIMAALLVVGAVSHGVLRHIVQTSPLWIGIVLGFRCSAFTKWATFPCFALWLLLMINIWFLLLGWPHFLSGTFSPLEIAMTLTIGVASLLGIIGAAGMKTNVRVWPAAATTLLMAALQVTVIWVSLLPQIAHR